MPKIGKVGKITGKSVYHKLTSTKSKPKITAKSSFRKGMKYKPKTEMTAEALFHKIIPKRPKITAERLFLKAQQMISRFGQKEKIEEKRKKITDATKKWKKITDVKKDPIKFPITPISEKKPAIMKIIISEKGHKFIEDLGKKFGRQFLDDIAIELRRIWSNLLAIGAKEINTRVPRDTGMLRWTLLTSLGSRYSVVPSTKPTSSAHAVLVVNFYSDLPYLQYVVAPHTHPYTGKPVRVAHHRSEKRRSRGKEKYLHDPDAKFGFMSLIRLHLKEQARRLTRSMIRSLSTRWGIPYNQIKGFFKYIGYKFR